MYRDVGHYGKITCVLHEKSFFRWIKVTPNCDITYLWYIWNWN